MIEYMLLDLDNTLYPKRSGLGKSMGARMSEFVERYLRIGPEEATNLRKYGLRRYGTTMSWLVREHGLTDVEEFIEYVHPTDLDSYLTQEDRFAAQEALRSIGRRASILTNAPREHAERVVRWLGIENCIEHIFDIRSNGFVGKPAPTAYESALQAVGAQPHSTLFVDDVLQYVLPFRDMGGYAVHVTDEPKHEPGVETIGSLPELVPLLERERNRR